MPPRSSCAKSKPRLELTGTLKPAATSQGFEAALLYQLAALCLARRIEAIAARADRDLSREIQVVIGGQLDLDAVPAPADLKIEAARAAVAPQRLYYAWDGARHIVADVDVVRAKKKLGGTRGVGSKCKRKAQVN